jgi:hypothetical protein
MIEQLQARLMKNANSKAGKGSISIWVWLGVCKNDFRFPQQ